MDWEGFQRAEFSVRFDTICEAEAFLIEAELHGLRRVMGIYDGVSMCCAFKDDKIYCMNGSFVLHGFCEYEMNWKDIQPQDADIDVDMNAFVEMISGGEE